MKKNTVRIIGLLLIIIGVICNQWILAYFFSSDGTLELINRLSIWIFDIVLIGVGLLILFQKTQIIINLSITVAVILLTLIIADLAARPLLKDMLYYRPEERFKNRWPPLPNLSKFERNVSYSGEVFGDLVAMSGQTEARELRNVEFKTDPYGYRNSKWDLDAPLDVIIIGDSFGSGVGTTQEKTLDSILSKKFNLNVYNLSMPGYNLMWELLCLKVEFPRLKAKDGTIVLWAVFAGNDLDTPYGDNLNPYPLNNAFDRFKVSLSTFKRRSPILRLTERITYRKSEDMVNRTVFVRKQPNDIDILFYTSYVKLLDRTYEEVKRHKNYNSMKRVIEDMGAFSLSNNLVVAVAMIPQKAEIYRWILDGTEPWCNEYEPTGFAVALKELCETEGFKFLDLKPYFLETARRLYEDSGELLWWRDGTHWNESGHALAASLVYEHLLIEQ